MNFNALDELDFYFGLIAFACMLVIAIGILLGRKFRSVGYKIVVFILSLGAAVLAYFCFRHEVDFPAIGTLFVVEALLGLVVIFRRRT